MKWPRVAPVANRWAFKHLSVEGGELVVPPDDLRIPLADVTQIEVACGLKGAVARVVRDEGKDVRLVVSSWRRLRAVLESLGFVAHAKRSAPDELMFVRGEAD